MPLKIPSEEDEIRQLVGSFESTLPELDTSTQRRSFIRGLVVALAKSIYHFYLTLKRHADFDIHPQTARGDFLYNGWWTALTGVTRRPPTGASGVIAATGTAGTLIPQGTVLSTGLVNYELDLPVSISEHTYDVIKVEYVNGTVYATTRADHSMATGMGAVISGLPEAVYNGSFNVVSTGTRSFNYAVPTAPATYVHTNTTGNVKATFAPAVVTATGTGTNTNVDGGALLTFTPLLPGVDSPAIVTHGGLAGGAEIETEDEFRARLLQALDSWRGTFTGDEIVTVTSQIPGVTRVWVRKAMLSPRPGWPAPGFARIAVMRDNDDNPFPGAQALSQVESALFTAIIPAHVCPDNIDVFAPTPKLVDVPVHNLVPDTSSMRRAVEASVKQYFDEMVTFGSDTPKQEPKNIEVRRLRCAIADTYDLERRQPLEDFTLGITSDIILQPDELAVLNTMVWA